jgi:hypothetical protein
MVIAVPLALTVAEAATRVCFHRQAPSCAFYFSLAMPLHNRKQRACNVFLAGLCGGL